MSKTVCGYQKAERNRRSVLTGIYTYTHTAQARGLPAHGTEETGRAGHQPLVQNPLEVDYAPISGGSGHTGRRQCNQPSGGDSGAKKGDASSLWGEANHLNQKTKISK